MGLQRSPQKNQNPHASSEHSQKATSAQSSKTESSSDLSANGSPMDAILNAIQLNAQQQQENFDIIQQDLKSLLTTQNSILSRLDKIESDSKTMVEKQSHLEGSLDELKCKVDEDVQHLNQKIESEVKTIQADLQEEILKMRKLSNLLIFGISEDAAGNQLLAELMQIISPTTNLANIRQERVGNNESKKPRPLRLKLSTQHERDLALKNKSKLKGNEKFAKVSIQKDLTKNQRLALRSPVVTRSSQSQRGKGVKRKSDEDTTEGGTAKADKIPKSSAEPSDMEVESPA